MRHIEVAGCHTRPCIRGGKYRTARTTLHNSRAFHPFSPFYIQQYNPKKVSYIPRDITQHAVSSPPTDLYALGNVPSVSTACWFLQLLLVVPRGGCSPAPRLHLTLHFTLHLTLHLTCISDPDPYSRPAPYQHLTTAPYQHLPTTPPSSHPNLAHPKHLSRPQLSTSPPNLARTSPEPQPRASDVSLAVRGSRACCRLPEQSASSPG